MRFFRHIENEKDLFYKQPDEFSKNLDRDTLSYCLGATLYMDGLRKDLMKDVEVTHATSVVICLEDAISSHKVQAAEDNVMTFLSQLDAKYGESGTALQLPLLFLRIRSVEQLDRFLNSGLVQGLTGFVFPKFGSDNGDEYFSRLHRYNLNSPNRLYGMPIIETAKVISLTSRTEELMKISTLLNAYRELVLNIRIGGTDFSGIYGLRRDQAHTIYDLAVIQHCISDIINLFKFEDYVISAPVNEFFHFQGDLEDYGFYKELLLDRMNGLIGKTVIHPKQVDIVNSLMAVSREDYHDARSIIASTEDGVIRSLYKNKMNEVKPHTKWARHILKLSRIAGVLNHGKDYRDLLSSSSSLSSSGSFENIIDY